MGKKYFACFRFAAILFLTFFLQTAYAQENLADTTAVDSTRISRVDSLFQPIIPIPLVGSMDRTISPEHVVLDSTINFSDYRSVSDLLTAGAGIFVRDLASPGELDGLTIQGLDARAIGFLSDGITLNDPMLGVFNTYLYPTENVDRVEFVQGTRAFLYSLNSTGGAVNLISKSKKAIHPYTHIRYSESVYGSGLFDGMFSQNLTRSLNVTGGVQHGTFDGEYPNGDEDAWNLRMKLRYNLNARLNIFASEIYNKTQVGLSGGVDTATAYVYGYDPRQAVMKNTDSYEKITRYDAQLGAAGEFFPDTTFVTALTLYHSTNFREYRDEEDRYNSNGIFVQQDDRTQWYGAKLSQHLELRKNRLDITAEVQSRGIVASSVTDQHLETAKSLTGKDEFDITAALQGALYVRFDNYLERFLGSFGSDASISPLSWLKVFGGYSRSYRFPTFQELYWRDSVVNASQSTFAPELHSLFEAGIRLSNGRETSIELSYFHRIVDDAIVTVRTPVDYPFPTFQFNQIDRQTYSGVEGTARVRFGEFVAEGSAQYLEISNDGGNQLLLPKWAASGGIYFWDKIVHDHLDLKVGFRGRVFTSYQGMEYNPQAWMFVPSIMLPVDAAGTSDLVVIAHLGDAYVHIIWQNLLDLQYIVTPFYPQLERSLRFGISWEFTN